MPMKYESISAETHPNIAKWIKSMTPVEEKEWNLSSTMSGEEFKSQVREMFDAADANHDQVLELGEFKQFSLFVLTAMAGLNLAQS